MTTWTNQESCVTYVMPTDNVLFLNAFDSLSHNDVD